MNLKYILFLAYKSLVSHKIRTALTAGGVVISVAFVVILISFGMGLQKISVEQVANIEALQILDVNVSKSKILQLNDSTMDKINSIGNVTEAIPQVSSATKMSYNKSEIDGVLYGKNIEFLNLEDVRLHSGLSFSSNSANEVIISLAAQNQLSSKSLLGKDISFDVIVQSDLLPKEQKGKKFSTKLHVVGIINDKDIPFAYTPLHTFTDNGIINYTSLKVKINSNENVAKAKLQIESLGFRASSIKETVDQINKFFGMFQVILILCGSISIFVACIGMFNTLTVTLLEKTREVGFMKALGTVRRDIYWLFTFESIIIGLVGGIIGVVSGCAIGKFINYTISHMAQNTGNQAVELFYLPLYMPFLIIAISFVISIITGLYPAHRASRISPLDAMRFE